MNTGSPCFPEHCPRYACHLQVLFKSAAYSVLESMGVARVSIIRCDGDMDTVVRVAYETVEDSACGGLDFEHSAVSSPGTR